MAWQSSTTYNKEKNTFHLGITMAGAVSAGAYTAGVIDYLLEALERWEQAKAAGEEVPTHNVVIDLFCGTSAGGMSGAITTAGLHDGIPPITLDKRNDEKYKEKNVLYHSWVNMTRTDMMKDLLNASDIAQNGVRSIFNSQFIEKIAERVVVNKNQQINKAYISGKLQIILSESNLTGIRYRVRFQGGADSTNEHITRNHRDFGHFQLNNHEDNERIPINFTTGENLKVLLNATMATGAFPAGLESRIIERDKKYLEKHILINPGADEGTKLEIDDPYRSLHIDGGMMNNEPFEVTEKYLREITKDDDDAASDHNKFSGTNIMIDPFPSNIEKDDEANGDPYDQRLHKVLMKTFRTMREQLRFKPDALEASLDRSNYSRFIIAPKRNYHTKDNEPVEGEMAIACGALDGFGGFFDQSFRAHDFYLGRRNCQRFLQYRFVVPESTNNNIFKQSYASEEVQKKYRVKHEDEQFYWPIIPDVNYNGEEKTGPDGENAFPNYNTEALKQLKRPLKNRIRAIAFSYIPNKLARSGVKTILFFGGKGMMRLFANPVEKEFRKWNLIRNEPTHKDLP